MNGGAITEEEARTLIRTAGGCQLNLRSLQSMALAGGMNGAMIGNYLTSKGSDSQVSCVEG